MFSTSEVCTLNIYTEDAVTQYVKTSYVLLYLNQVMLKICVKGGRFYQFVHNNILYTIPTLLILAVNGQITV